MVIMKRKVFRRGVVVKCPAKLAKAQWWMKSRTSPKLMLAARRVSQCSKCNATSVLAAKISQLTTNYIPLTVGDDTSCRSTNYSRRLFSLSISQTENEGGGGGLQFSKATAKRANRLNPDAFLSLVVLNLKATRFCRCLGSASSSYSSLRNNDPSQRSNHNNGVGRCRWWCATNGKPCNIVDCVW